MFQSILFFRLESEQQIKPRDRECQQFYELGVTDRSRSASESHLPEGAGLIGMAITKKKDR
jgi:hypothetical protein